MRGVPVRCSLCESVDPGVVEVDGNDLTFGPRYVLRSAVMRMERPPEPNMPRFGTASAAVDPAAMLARLVAGQKEADEWFIERSEEAGRALRALADEAGA